MTERRGDLLQSSYFSNRIGDTFAAVAADGTPIELVLRRSEETSYGDPARWVEDVSRVPFALEFHTTSEHAVGQQTFVLDDERLGELAVFMTPLGPEGDAMRYEAVFS